MLKNKEIKEIQDALDNSQNPLFFYDDDPDGVCSFIILYRRNKEGKSIIVKSSPKLDMRFFNKIEELNPDKIFILDKPMTEEEFIEKAKRPVYWIDHHDYVEHTKAKYYNPRKNNPNAYIPTTRMAYQINPDKKIMWLAMVGCLGDYYIPDFAEEFSKEHPELLSSVKSFKDIMQKESIGTLVRVVSFLLKGPTSEVRKCVKILTRIDNPSEILQQTTSQGKYLYKKFYKIDEEYQKILKNSLGQVTGSKLYTYIYSELKSSFTIDLANEMTTRYPKKVIIIARKKSEEFKCSIRAHYPIKQALLNALEGIEGYGGGHENACGAVIKEHNWELFLKKFKEEIKKINTTKQ